MGLEDEPPLKRSGTQKTKTLKLKLKTKLQLANIKLIKLPNKLHYQIRYYKVLLRNFIARQLNSIQISSKGIILKLSKKQFTALILTGVISISGLSTSQAANIVSENKDVAIGGDSQAIVQTVNNVNAYIPKIEETSADIVPQDKDIDIEYAAKPEITDTEDTVEKERLAKIKAEEEARKKQLANTRTYSTYTSSNSLSSTGNTYAYGYCTWYAAQKRPDIPNQLGNGGSWYINAQRNGIATGQTPQTGSIIVTGESWAGHVGYVEAVNGDQVTISEMNFNGWNRVSTRTIDKDSAIIKGYIY